MTIGIDLRVLARGARTGIEEYTINLLSHLLPSAPQIKFKLFYNAFQRAKLFYPWLFLPNVELREFGIPNRLFLLAARYLNQPKIDRLLQGVDIYFNPHFFVAPLSKRCRKIMTFHDLAFLRYPEFFSWRQQLWQKFLMKARAEAEKSDQIIAVSQSTKQDLIDLYGIKPDKIKVIYSGIGQQFRETKPVLPQIKNKYHLPDRFILYLGTIEPRKNLLGLLKAFELLKTKNNSFGNLKLVIAGRPGWLYQDIFRTAQHSFYCQEIIFTGFVAEQDKPFLYNSAEVFVCPSFFEGFGFPPLEAMACGLPTIVSANSSLPEVVGSAALMVDPYNIDEMAWAMELILSDADLRERLKKEGIEQAKKFSWQKCARETLKTLLEVGEN